MGILHWMKGRTDCEKGQKAFSSDKRQKKTQERTEGFRKERKLPPGRACGAMEGTQMKACVWMGWKGLGVVKRNVYCLKPLHGDVWPQNDILQNNPLPPSTLNATEKLLPQCLITQSKCSTFFSKQMLPGLRQFKFAWKHTKAGTHNENCCLMMWISTSYICTFFFSVLGLFWTGQPQRSMCSEEKKELCASEPKGSSASECSSKTITASPVTNKSPHYKYEVLKSETSHHTQLSWETNRKDLIVFRDRCCQRGCNYNHHVCHSCVVCHSPHPLSFQRVLVQEEELQIILQHSLYIVNSPRGRPYTIWTHYPCISKLHNF